MRPGQFFFSSASFYFERQVAASADNLADNHFVITRLQYSFWHLNSSNGELIHTCRMFHAWKINESTIDELMLIDFGGLNFRDKKGSLIWPFDVIKSIRRIIGALTPLVNCDNIDPTQKAIMYYVPDYLSYYEIIPVNNDSCTADDDDDACFNGERVLKGVLTLN